MKSKNKLLVTLAVLLITLSSFIVKNNSNQSNQVMLYGVVYTTKCNTEASMTFVTKLVSANNYNADQDDFKKQLQTWYPNASRIRVSSSKYDYGNSASNSCVISWTKNNNNCSYKVISVCFGKTEQEALNKAIDLKNTWAGSNTNYNIEEQKYW
jgi:hypothetical protein